MANDPTVSSELPTYYQAIEDDLSGRKTWNNKDNLIIKRRLGERPKSDKPYPSAPNPVVNIIDDVVSSKTDNEISMIMNAPYFSYFIPVGQCPTSMAQMAQRGFDTFLRHYMNYRAKKEEAVDCKNARGFSVTKIIREEHPDLGVIPSFETVDPKDIIVPLDTRDVQSAERIVHVLRYSPRTLKAKKKRGWKNVDELLGKMAAKDDEKSTGITSYHDDQDNSTLRTTESLIGINASDYAEGRIVVWEIAHYATQWDVDNYDGPDELEVGRKCLTYICPDHPGMCLYVKAWKEEDVVTAMTPEEFQAEQVLAVQEGRMPKNVRTEPGADRPWPYVQHRYEYRSRWWYDSRGLGHTCMDDQLAATGMMRRKLIWADFATSPLFENDGNGTNPTNVKIAPGSIIPRGLKLATPPSPPANLDFDIDYFKRDASQRAGAGSAMYSAEVSASRKLEKTATEVQSQDAKQSLVSSASVDRFNDADRELFRQLWADMKRLNLVLPIIDHGQFVGQMSQEVYSYSYVITPAASQKTLNPDLQFLKAKEALSFAAGFAQMGVPLDVSEGLFHVLTQYDPNFADTIRIDPAQAGPQGQPPIYQILQQLMQASQQHDQEIDAVMKLAAETADKTEGADVRETEGPAVTGQPGRA